MERSEFEVMLETVLKEMTDPVAPSVGDYATHKSLRALIKALQKVASERAVARAEKDELEFNHGSTVTALHGCRKQLAIALAKVDEREQQLTLLRTRMKLHGEDPDYAIEKHPQHAGRIGSLS